MGGDEMSVVSAQFILEIAWIKDIRNVSAVSLFDIGDTVLPRGEVKVTLR